MSYNNSSNDDDNYDNVVVVADDDDSSSEHQPRKEFYPSGPAPQPSEEFTTRSDSLYACICMYPRVSPCLPCLRRPPCQAAPAQPLFALLRRPNRGLFAKPGPHATNPTHPRPAPPVQPRSGSVCIPSEST